MAGDEFAEYLDREVDALRLKLLKKFHACNALVNRPPTAQQEMLILQPESPPIVKPTASPWTIPDCPTESAEVEVWVSPQPQPDLQREISSSWNGIGLPPKVGRQTSVGSQVPSYISSLGSHQPSLAPSQVSSLAVGGGPTPVASSQSAAWAAMRTSDRKASELSVEDAVTDVEHSNRIPGSLARSPMGAEKANKKKSVLINGTDVDMHQFEASAGVGSVNSNTFGTTGGSRRMSFVSRWSEKYSMASSGINKLFHSRRGSVASKAQAPEPEQMTVFERWARLVKYVHRVQFKRRESINATNLHPFWTTISLNRHSVIDDEANATSVSEARRQAFVNQAAVKAWNSNGKGMKPSGLFLAEKHGDLIVDANARFQSIVVHPDSTVRVLWLVLSVPMLLYDFISIPLESIGLIHLPPRGLSGAMFTYWLLDMLMQFFTGYHTENVVEMRPNKTAKRYARLELPLDIFILMVDFMFLVWSDELQFGHLSKHMRHIRLIRLLRLVRLGRCRRLSIVLNIVQNKVFSQYITLTMQLTQLVGIVLMMCHYIACVWYGISDAYTDSSKSSWVTVFDMVDEPGSYKYATSLHWSLTQCTPATNDITPTNEVERVFAIFVVLWAMIVFSSVISRVTNAMNQLWILSSAEVQERVRVKAFLNRRDISMELGSRILQFLSANTALVRPVQERELQILKMIPETVRMQLYEEMYAPALRRNRLFLFLTDLSTRFLRQLCRAALQELYFVSQQEVFVENLRSTQVYCPENGMFLYWWMHLGVPETQRVHKGDWMSEFTLWAEWTHVGDLVAESIAQVMALDAEMFHLLVMEQDIVLKRNARNIAIFCVMHMDQRMGDGNDLDDRSLDQQEVSDILQRSQRLEALNVRSKVVQMIGPRRASMDDTESQSSPLSKHSWTDQRSGTKGATIPMSHSGTTGRFRMPEDHADNFAMRFAQNM